MAIQYRAIQPGEEAQVMRLWTTVFASTPEWYFQTQLDAEPRRKPHQTLVAVDHGRIVSAVHYYIRPTRALDGTIKKMGGIANVATYDDARKQGHSGKLLQMSIEKMARDGCLWSLLGTGVNGHYERYGWKTMKTRFREGALAAAQPHDDSWTVVPVIPGDHPGWWEPLARIYDSFNAKRPLTYVRSAKHWELVLLPRLNQPGAVVYVAWPKDCSEAAGYAVAYADEKTLRLAEVGALPGYDGALPALMDVVRALAVHRGSSKIVANVPFEPAVNAALLRLIKAPKIEINTGWMVRSLSDAYALEEIERAFAMDGPNVWPLDDF